MSKKYEFTNAIQVVECKKLCDHAYHAALLTEGKLADTNGTPDWHAKLYEAEHSPMRAVLFWIVLEIPYWVSVHLVRHKIGVEHFVSSQRNDRQTAYDRTKAPQDAPVLHGMLINAQALVTMSRKRLCGKASPPTREAWEKVVRAIYYVDPMLAYRMVPECVYRGGRCHEFKSCGKSSLKQ